MSWIHDSHSSFIFALCTSGILTLRFTLTIEPIRFYYLLCYVICCVYLSNPTQRASNKNPIRDCMRDLREKCGGSATEDQIKIVDTAVMWYDEVCVPGQLDQVFTHATQYG